MATGSVGCPGEPTSWPHHPPLRPPKQGNPPTGGRQLPWARRTTHPLPRPARPGSAAHQTPCCLQHPPLPLGPTGPCLNFDAPVVRRVRQPLWAPVPSLSPPRGVPRQPDALSCRCPEGQSARAPLLPPPPTASPERLGAGKVCAWALNSAPAGALSPHLLALARLPGSAGCSAVGRAGGRGGGHVGAGGAGQVGQSTGRWDQHWAQVGLNRWGGARGLGGEHVGGGRARGRGGANR